MSKTMAKAGNTSALNLFIPLTKVDEEKRLVYGTITKSTKDRAGEICDYAASKPNFEKWSGDIAKVTGGKSLGNVRAMHKAVAAGKLTDLGFDDPSETITCCAKVVDDNEWAKVLEGVYTGFSQGGKYGKRWTDENGDKRYEAIPTEVSLVDLPCLPEATFEVVKADGATEMRKFHSWEPTNEEIVPAAKELAKVAGDETAWPEQITQARGVLLAKHADAVMEKAAEVNAELEGAEAPAEPAAIAKGAAEGGASTENGVEGQAAAEPAETVAKAAPELKQVQLWETSDGKQFAKKADARAHESSLQTPVQKALAAAMSKAAPAAAAVEGEVIAKGAPCPELRPVQEAARFLFKAHGEQPLIKGLYSVGSLARLICELNWLTQDSAWEEQYEGDDASVVPGQLATSLRNLGTTLVAMASEEVGEMIAALQGQGIEVEVIDPDADPTILELAAKGVDLAKAAGDELVKAGKRNSAKDQDVLNAIHDHSVSLGATCEGGDAAKMAKAATLAQENEALRKDVGEAVAGITVLGERMEKMAGELATARGEIEVLKAQPAPDPRDLAKAGQLVLKDGDAFIGTRADASEIVRKAVEERGAEGVALDLFKVAQQRPMLMVGRGARGE